MPGRSIDGAEYRFEHGDLWFQSSSKHFRVGGPSDFLAVAFDPEEGVLHKHGPEEAVQRWADQTREKFRNVPEDIRPSLAVLSFPIRQETVDELNACIATSGRVMHLERRLTEMGEAFGPAIRYPK